MKKEIQVSGMNCGSCEMLVTEALEDLEGVIDVNASHLKGIVSVDFDPNMVAITNMLQIG